MAEQPPAAGTPPANPPAQGGEPPAADSGKTLTQAEINKIVEESLARDRSNREDALAKELGMSLKDAKAVIAAKKTADAAAKSELEKITGERDNLKGELTGTKLENAKLREFMKAGADPDKIDALMKRVVGATPEEIATDVLELKALGLLQPKIPGDAQGAGNPGLPKQKQPPNLDEQIKIAQTEALKTGNWDQYNKLTLQKQRPGPG